MKPIKILILTIIAVVIFTGCGNKEENNPTYKEYNKNIHPAYKEKKTSKTEWMAESPNGKLSPIFSTEGAVKDYIDKHSSEFGTGTIIHRR